MSGFFIGKDNDGHTYVVAADQRERWNAWLNLNSDDPAAWETPIFALRIGNPADIEFPSFTERK